MQPDGRPDEVDMTALLGARLKSLEQANQHLLQVNRGLQCFTTSATHDLRAPLHCLQQFQQRLLAELQAHPAALAACQALLKQQQSTLDCMQQLIDGMLELARVGHLQPQADAVDCNELAARIVEQLRAQYPDHPVAIRIDCGPPLHADRRLLRSLFYNLLSNAWKFTRTTAAPRVELCRGSEREPTFRLSDNGVGFDMRYAQRLFEPFQRLHASSDFPGAGIGLATAARIVEHHGGRIWATAQVGAGASFHFTLPAAAADDPAAAHSSGSEDACA